MTVQELVDEIARKALGNSSNIDSDFQNVCLDAVRSALRRIPRFAKVRSVVKTVYATLNASTQSLDIFTITDFFEERQVYHLLSGKREIIHKLDYESFNEIYSNATTGQPQFYRIVGKTLEFDKKADKNYTIYIEYFGNDSNVALTDTLTLRDDVLEIVKDGALEYVFDHLEDNNKSTRHGQKFIAGLEKLEVDYHRQEDPDFIEVVD